jgi:biotin carboxyl carrier protein
VIFDASLAGRTLRVEVRLRDDRYHVRIDGEEHEVDYRETGPGFASLLLDGASYEIGLERRGQLYVLHFPAGTLEVELHEAARGAAGGGSKPQGPARVTAPMPGKIVRVLAAPGQDIEAGQGLVVMEAMKMENELRAPRSGRVDVVAVHEGQAVEAGVLLAVVS